jgi:hypothetical protein
MLMNINLKKMVLVASLLIAAGFASNTLAQQAPAKASSQLRIVSFHGDMASLLSAMGPSFGVTIGFEADPLKPNSEVTVEVRDGLLPDVLNAIVKSEPRYQWREVDGVFEVFPINGTNPFLEITISTVRLSDVTAAEAINQLMDLPEVRPVVMSMKLKHRAANTSSRASEQKFSINLGRVTLRQALNQIAKESGIRFWIFRKYDDETFSIGPTL